MSEKSLGVLNDIATNTTLNNLLDLMENRLSSLDHASKILVEEILQWKQILSIAIRVTGDIKASDKVISGIKMFNICIMKYKVIMDEFIVQQIIERYLLNIRNCLEEAAIKTMQTMDKRSFGLFDEVLQNRGIIKTSYSVDGGAMDKFKSTFKRKKKEA